MVFESAPRAEAFVEPPFVDEGTTYDADGQLLKFTTDGRRTYLHDTGQRNPEALRMALLSSLAAAGVEVAADASLEDLVAEAAQRFTVG